MLEKLKSILGRGASGPNPPKQSIEPVTLSLHEIKDWLDKQEEECKKERNEALTQSRAVIEQLLEIIRKQVPIVEEVPTEKELHPKVVQVNTQQLPLFKSKMLAALEVTFSDDDEEFYAQTAVVLNATFRAFRGPGKYLHQSYPQGIREMRDQLDSFGKEINIMTAAIRTARERLVRIEEVHHTYDAYKELISQYSNVDALKNTMEARLKECEKELLRAQDGKAAYQKSEEYQIYDVHKIDLEQQRELVDEEKKALQIRLNTTIQVWKRAMHELYALSDKKSGDSISKCITLMEQSGVESDPDTIITGLKTVVNPLFRLIEADKIVLKNAAERVYFSSPAEYLDELHEAFQRYNQKKVKYEEAKDALAKQQAPEILLEMQEHIQKLQEEMTDIETKLSKKARKKVNEEEIEKGRDELLEKMTACVNYDTQTQTQIPVIITDLMDDVS